MVENVPAALVSRINIGPHMAEEAVEWLKRTFDVPYTLSFNHQLYEVDGCRMFWGSMVLSTRHGGKGPSPRIPMVRGSNVPRMLSQLLVDSCRSLWDAMQHGRWY